VSIDLVLVSGTTGEPTNVADAVGGLLAACNSRALVALTPITGSLVVAGWSKLDEGA